MENITHMLWTGGWDSTYRLIELLAIEKKSVQTYYIIDPSRRSSATEITTMGRLRQQILKKWPECADRFRLSRLVERDSIKPNEEITQQYWRLATKERLGIQYEWIVRMAKEFGIEQLELSIEARQNNFVWRNIRPFMDRENPDDKTSYRLMYPPANPDVALFSCFRWPIIELTKLDMKANAILHGFNDIMKHTWFCHKPTIFGTPCGVCMPCRIAVEDGMGDRLPFPIRIRKYYEFKIKTPIRNRIQPRKVHV
jgi:hypothetical protein